MGKLDDLCGSAFSRILPWYAQRLPTWTDKIYNYDPKSEYDDRSVYELVRFIRNVFNHFDPSKYAINVVNER